MQTEGVLLQWHLLLQKRELFFLLWYLRDPFFETGFPARCKLLPSQDALLARKRLRALGTLWSSLEMLFIRTTTAFQQ